MKTSLALFAASIAFLTTKQWRWDAIAAASCELGMVFATVVLITGPLWARSAWNTVSIPIPWAM